MAGWVGNWLGQWVGGWLGNFAEETPTADSRHGGASRYGGDDDGIANMKRHVARVRQKQQDQRRYEEELIATLLLMDEDY